MKKMGYFSDGTPESSDASLILKASMVPAFSRTFN
jgi:hypothetical protein